MRATPDLPLARIKKIMKLDDNVKMISSEVPLLFSKAATVFIEELTLRAWLHTEEAKRKTLQVRSSLPPQYRFYSVLILRRAT